MELQFNFHKRTGLAPGVYPFRSNYGTAGTVYGLRVLWSALTVTLYKN